MVNMGRYVREALNEENLTFASEKVCNCFLHRAVIVGRGGGLVGRTGSESRPDLGFNGHDGRWEQERVARSRLTSVLKYVCLTGVQTEVQPEQISNGDSAYYLQQEKLDKM